MVSWAQKRTVSAKGVKSDFRFLTLPALARRIDFSDGPLRARLADGRLVPDGEVDLGSGKALMPVFAVDRLEEIRRAMTTRPAVDVEA